MMAQRAPASGAGQHCHKLIAKTAQEMAYELYDAMMANNVWYKFWREQHPGMGPKGLARTFVAANWGTLVPEARATLAGMLAQPIPDHLKDEIHEALILDRTLPSGKAHSAVRRV